MNECKLYFTENMENERKLFNGKSINMEKNLLYQCHRKNYRRVKINH